MKRTSLWILCAALGAGCGGNVAPDDQAAAEGAARAATTGRPKVMIVEMENMGYDKGSGLARYVVGSPNLPRINGPTGLLNTYGRLSDAWSPIGPVNDGYNSQNCANTHNPPDGSHVFVVAFAAGTNFNLVCSDAMFAKSPGTGFNATTQAGLLTKLDDQGVNWQAFIEDMPTDLTSDKTEDNGKTYMARHAAWVSDWARFNVSPHHPRVHDMGSTGSYSGLGHSPTWPTVKTALTGTTTPDFMLVVPTAANNGHKNWPTTGVWKAPASHQNPDQFMTDFTAMVIQTDWYKQGGNLVFWWDEGSDQSKSGIWSGAGHKAVIVVSARAKAAASRTVNTTTNDFGILADLEDLYGVTRLNQSAGDSHTAAGVGAFRSLLNGG